VRATKPELFSPRRDGGLDLLPFLDASRLSVSLRKQSGDTWRAAFRPFKPVPVLVPLAFASLPNRDTNSSASPPKLSPQSVVRIDEHGSKDRAKDASLRQARSLVRAVRCMPFVAHADDVPLLGDLRTSAVIGATACRGGTTACKADRPRPPFQRHPAKSAAFQKTRMPFTGTCAKEMSRRDCSLRPPRRLSRSRRPHFSPVMGKVLLMGIARPRCGHPQVRDIRECGRLLDSLTVRAWD
jgi:hypothetical protein